MERALATQDEVQKQEIMKMRQERADLVKSFSGDSDLRSKTLVQGIGKVCVLGMIKYH
jgi:hypothetical protein